MANFPDPKDIMFYAAIGRLTVAWANVEAGLDMLIDVIHRHLDGKRVDEERPRSLQRKLSYMKDYLTVIGLDDQGSKPYRALLTEIKVQSDFRHDIIHGFVTEMAVGSGEAKLLRFLHQKERFHQKTIEVDTAKIMKAARDAESIGRQTIGIFIKFSDEILALHKLAEEQKRH
jgi:hypothetical protein